MSRFAAVFCHQAPCLRILKTALREAGIDYLHCRSQQQALELTLGGECALVIVDFALPESGEIARLATLLPPPLKPVVLALGGEWPGNGEAFQSGANRILYRPLVAGQVRDALQGVILSRSKGARGQGRKTAHSKLGLPRLGLAKRAVAKLGLANPRLADKDRRSKDCRSKDRRNDDRRSAARSGFKTLVYLDLRTGSLPAIGIDLSEQGLSVQASEQIPANARLSFRCVLPGTAHTLRGEAEVIWTDDHGRAGMFFSHLPPTSRKLLKQWLSRGHVHQADAVRVLLPQESFALFS